MPRLKMLPTTGLRKQLEQRLLIEEEIEMWVWYGYYITFNDVEGEGHILDNEGDMYEIDSGLAKRMRQAAMVRWDNLLRQRPEAVKVVEVDSFREALESRNDG